MTTALVIATAAAVIGWALFFIALVGGNDQLVEVTAERDALLVVTDEQEADLATYRRNAIRSVKTAPAASNVIDLIARNEAARHLTNESIHNWLTDWTTDNGDAS